MLYGALLSEKHGKGDLILPFSPTSQKTIEFEGYSRGEIGEYGKLSSSYQKSRQGFRFIEGSVHKEVYRSTEEEEDLYLDISKTEGIFSFVHWNQEKRVLTIGNDRYGIRPLYYYHSADGFYFASEFHVLVALVPGKIRLNRSALAEFLAFRHPFGDHTLFEGIQRIPQGKILQLSYGTNKIQAVSCFDYRRLIPNANYAFKDVIHDADGQLSGAISRQINGFTQTGLLLSGGYDSRIMASGLSRTGITVKSVTGHKDYSYRTDEIVAEEIARKLGFTHQFVPLRNDYIAAYHRRKCQKTNYDTSYHVWVMSLAYALPDGLGINIDGLGGDGCLGASEITSEMWNLWRLNRNTSKLQKTFYAWYKTAFERLIRKKWVPSIENLAMKGIQSELNNQMGHPNGLIYLGLRNFTRRAMALSGFGILQSKAETLCPFFDHELFQWTMSIPIEHKMNYKLYNEVIKVFASELSSIPTTHDRPDGRYYFRKGSAYWKNKPNLNYLNKILFQKLEHFWNGMLEPNLKGRLSTGRVTGAERDALLALADVGIFMETFQSRIKWEKW